MAFFNTPYFGGFGLGFGEATAPPAVTKPETGETIGRQTFLGFLNRSNPKLGALPFGSYAALAMQGEEHSVTCGPYSGDYANGINGMPYRLPGEYWLYRLMIGACPTIALARAVIGGPIFTARPSFELRKGAPEVWQSFIQRKFEPIWLDLLLELFRSLDYGWRGCEKVWDTESSPLGSGEPSVVTVVKKFKWLRPDRTMILTDAHGNFVGLRQGMTDVFQSQLKSWLYTNDLEDDNLYGRPRLENVVYPFTNWWELSGQLRMIGDKFSGMYLVVKVPPGSTLVNGQRVSNIESGDLMARQFKNKGHVVFENVWGAAENIENHPELADTSSHAFDTVDMGNSHQAIGGILDAEKYEDSMIFRGMLRPEREALAANKGGLGESDSKQHASIGTLDSGQLMQQFYGSINANAIDDSLVANFGEQARGGVKAVPPGVSEEEQVFSRTIIAALLANPATTFRAAAVVDWDSEFDKAGLSRKEGVSLTFDANEVDPYAVGQGEGDPTTLKNTMQLSQYQAMRERYTSAGAMTPAKTELMKLWEKRRNGVIVDLGAK